VSLQVLLKLIFGKNTSTYSFHLWHSAPFSKSQIQYTVMELARIVTSACLVMLCQGKWPQ